MTNSILPIPPGYTIKEQLEDRKMTQKEFAHRMQVSEKHISQLMHGEVRLTPEIAERLELVLGIPARFWNDYEARYREKLLKLDQEKKKQQDVEIASKFPYSEMAKLNWVDKTRKMSEKVENLRKFFEVVSLDLALEEKLSSVSWRKLSEDESKYYALVAWIQQAKLLARKIDTEKFDRNKLQQYIPVLRSMTRQSPEEFSDDLVEILRVCGISLVFVPHLKGTYLHGATFKQNGKPIIALTIRGKDADKFWFSFFHEIGHILLEHNTRIGIEEEVLESEADNYAKETLIDSKLYTSFINKKSFSKSSIIEFAQLINIDEGIVLGRLQKDGYVPYSSYNSLKKKYVLS